MMNIIKNLMIIFVLTYLIFIYVYFKLIATFNGHTFTDSQWSNLFNWWQCLCVCAILLIISWLTASAIHERLWSTTFESVEKRAILITGCDSGFGHQLAIQCHRLGYHVFAGVLFADQSGAQEMLAIGSDRIKVVKMDVTNAQQVQDVIEMIRKSGLDLWAVVNNAGISLATPVSWGHDVREVEKTFAVNVFGAIRVTKLCLPLLYRSKGRIINMSSIAGLVTPPSQTTYCMSKYALRSFSDGLRREISEYGIKVVTIEPNLYRTPIVNFKPFSVIVDNIWNESNAEIKHMYGESGPDIYFAKLKIYFQSARTKTDEVIEALIKAIRLKRPQTYYRCASAFDLIWLWFFCSLSPVIQDFLYIHFNCNLKAYKWFVKVQRFMSFNKCANE